MQSQIKYMLAVNAVFAVAFIVANLFYVYFSGLHPTTIIWSPLQLTWYNPQAAATIGDVGSAEPNFSFYFFWALLLINGCFLIKLGRKAP
jgi:hypothetical protein